MSIDTTATSQVEGTVEDLEQMLGGGEESSTTEAEEAEQPSETTDGQTDEGAEAEAEEATETAEEAEEEAGAVEEEADEAETESFDENDDDYSEAKYKQAAEHYSKTKKIQLNPEDPTHRVLLKELMDRGRDFKSLKEQREQEAAAKTDEGKTADETAAPAAKTPPTEEQIQGFLTNVEKFASEGVIPQVSMKIANGIADSLASALWGKEYKGGIKLTQEAADKLTKALRTAFYAELEQASPLIAGLSLQTVSQDPLINRMVSNEVKSQALENLIEPKDGKQLYPDLEKMVDGGQLRKVMTANPWIAQIKAGNGKDLVKNYEAQVGAAYKIAHGESTADQVRQAVQTGKNQAKTHANKVAASRVAAGKSKGGFVKEKVSDVDRIVSGSGSKFGAAVAAASRA